MTCSRLCRPFLLENRVLLFRIDSRYMRQAMANRGKKAYTSDVECPPLTKDKVRVYSMRFCPFAQRARLVLAYKNIPNECINIHLGDKPKWFLEKYDAGTVPVLEINDKIIPESLVTSEYLDEVYPGPKLVPSDPFVKAKHNALIQRYGKIITKYYKSLRGQLEEGEDPFAELKYFEDELATVKGGFFGGEQPCFLDLMIWPWCERFEIIKEFPKCKDSYPKFVAWIEKMLTLPAVQAELLNKDLHLGFYEGYKTGKPDYDFGL